MTQPTSTPVIDAFVLRQKITPLINRYYVRRTDSAGTEQDVVAFAEQKRMKLREEVVFFADESKSQVLFSFKARKRLDLASTYDVVDGSGAPIGSFRKDFAASLLRSTWHVQGADGSQSIGTERRHWVAILRRVWGFLPFIGEIPLPFQFHFDFHALDGTPVLSSTKKLALRDIYRIDLHPDADGGRLDWRLGAAVAVALDAFQGR